MNILKGYKDRGSYVYRGKVEDILENKFIEVKGEVVEIEPMFHFKKSEGMGMIIYSIIGDKDLMVISNYNYDMDFIISTKNKSKKTNICRYKEFFYDDYELSKHIMDKYNLFNFISELETVVYHNNISEDDDFYKAIKNMKEYYISTFY